MRTRTIYRDGRAIAIYKNDELVYSDPSYREKTPNSMYVMPDISPYRSMIDGSEITSRSRHREHLKAHGCLEVGDQTHHLKQKPVTVPPGLKETLIGISQEKLRYK